MHLTFICYCTFSMPLCLTDNRGKNVSYKYKRTQLRLPSTSQPKTSYSLNCFYKLSFKLCPQHAHLQTPLPNIPTMSIIITRENATNPHTTSQNPLPSPSPRNAPAHSTQDTHTVSYALLNARFMRINENGVAIWKVDSTNGPDVWMGKRLLLVDKVMEKAAFVEVESAEWLEREWLYLHLTSDAPTALIIPKPRMRLGLLMRATYLLRYPWMSNSIPPPVSPTTRSTTRSTIHTE